MGTTEHGLRDDVSRNGRLWHRLCWFAAIWLASVATLAVIAWAIRLVLLPN